MFTNESTSMSTWHIAGAYSTPENGARDGGTDPPGVRGWGMARGQPLLISSEEPGPYIGHLEP